MRCIIGHQCLYLIARVFDLWILTRIGIAWGMSELYVLEVMKFKTLVYFAYPIFSEILFAASSTN
jgi:hypothetical protein